jgi:predicted regulator of Ras-like GTPase activity (Roadblock/LC7/MglB family)
MPEELPTATEERIRRTVKETLSEWAGGTRERHPRAWSIGKWSLIAFIVLVPAVEVAYRLGVPVSAVREMRNVIIATLNVANATVTRVAGTAAVSMNETAERIKEGGPIFTSSPTTTDDYRYKPNTKTVLSEAVVTYDRVQIKSGKYSVQGKDGKYFEVNQSSIENYKSGKIVIGSVGDKSVFITLGSNGLPTGKFFPTIEMAKRELN